MLFVISSFSSLSTELLARLHLPRWTKQNAAEGETLMLQHFVRCSIYLD